MIFKNKDDKLIRICVYICDNTIYATKLGISLTFGLVCKYEFVYFASMEIAQLLRHLLPEELFEYFELVSIKDTKEKELSLYLDEKKILPPEHKDKSLISYGFDEPITV